MVNKDNKQGSSSNKDKSKIFNKNQDVVNDGVVDNVFFKPQKVVFNLTTTMQVAKAIKQATVETKPSSKYARSKSWASQPKREYTPLGEPLDVVYKTLLQNNILAPLDKCLFDPQP